MQLFLFHEMGRGEWTAYSRGGAYFKFRQIGGALVRRGRLFEGGGGGEDLRYRKPHWKVTKLKSKFFLFLN